MGERSSGFYEAVQMSPSNETHLPERQKEDDDVIERLHITIKDSTVVRRVDNVKKNRFIAAHYEATGELLELDDEE